MSEQAVPCREYRTTFIDYDARRRPKTSRSCVRCQRDIKPNITARVVHVVNECYALHPEDEAEYIAAGTPNDNGYSLIGPDCARVIGLEWTQAESEAGG